MSFTVIPRNTPKRHTTSCTWAHPLCTPRRVACCSVTRAAAAGVYPVETCAFEDLSASCANDYYNMQTSVRSPSASRFENLIWTRHTNTHASPARAMNILSTVLNRLKCARSWYRVVFPRCVLHNMRTLLYYAHIITFTFAFIYYTCAETTV